MQEVTNKFWAIGGGKGGVGKSIVSIMLGSALAAQGKKVVLVDADLGGSNLHTLVGIRYPLYTLADFISRKVDNIEDVVMDTPVANLKLICGADDILGIANPKSTQKARLFNNLKRLDADYILLDLGAGTSFTTIDFFLFAPNKIVVMTPQITSIQNSYGFIKASLYRGLSRAFRKETNCLELIKKASSGEDSGGAGSITDLFSAFKSLDGDQAERLRNYIDNMSMRLIVNMVRDDKEKNVGNIVRNVAKNYLDLDIENLGLVRYDRVIEASINKMDKFLSNRNNGNGVASVCFYDIAGSIMKSSNRMTA
ncbi:MAG: P-loop NTPase [Nitrospira sp.]|nr:P-loop NTPase [bacterium]MBL7049163.1 P-loop NTPase [Nitrospira sp.]